MNTYMSVRPRRVVLAAFGPLGDLHPASAIAPALAAGYRKRARELGARVRAEDGATRAAVLIEAL